MPRNDEILKSLTSKQREVLALLGEGRTGKEIAGALGISESAVVQRIEKVRLKFDGATRQQLGRIWRDYAELSPQKDCKHFTGKSFQLPPDAVSAEMGRRYKADTHVEFMDSAIFQTAAPWEDEREPRIVPEVLEGENASTFRWLYAVAAALGIACLLLVLLAVSNAVSQLV